MTTTHDTRAPLRRGALFFLAASLLATTACGGDADSGGWEYGGPSYAPAQNSAEDTAGETYDEVPENEFIDAAEENTSTFSIDVDNASYTLMRRDIESGRLPQKQSVRPEEYINFFDYDYAEPTGEDPFSINLEVAPSRFGEGKHLMRVGLKGKEGHLEDLKPTNLVFLIDVSGSMQSDRKLGLVKTSLNHLLDHLRPTDTVGIVVYAGADGVVLNPTQVRDDDAIKDAINNLAAGGSTNGEAGIVRAYQMAQEAKVEDGNNRVIILTDGDFNVGRIGESLFELIDEYRAKHISLTCMGYGLGNYNDHTMENLSKRGNGNYFYVDSEQEAQRVFGTELPSTLEVIASDVKIQVEFNTDAVTRYRLVGYDNRVLDNEDFDDDAVDAGEIGYGHTVTAYYEVELAESVADDSLLSTVRLRYKPQYGDDSKLLERGIKVAGMHQDFGAASADFRFGAAVAEYAEVLRRSKHVDSPDLQAVREVLASAQRAGDAKHQELLGLIDRAITLWK